MPNNCSILLRKDKLPQIISKVEYFMFRAMEQDGTHFSKIIGDTKEAEVKRLLDIVYNKTIPEYIAQYEGMAKASLDEGDKEGAAEFEVYAQNLENLRSNWKDIVANFKVFSQTFKIQNHYKLNEEGLVEDESENADDSKVLARMVFDKVANETNPLDEIDKMVELFLKSLPNEEFSDDYGFTVSMNYAELSRQIMNDVQNSTSIEEIKDKLEKNKANNPVYSRIIEKLDHTPDASKEETAFRIAFRNSFVKAFIPIYIVSIEDKNVIKVIEAAKGSFSLFEKRIDSNFLMKGFPVSNGVNLAHQNEHGMWVMDKSDLPKLIDYIENAPLAERVDRQLGLLEGLGIELSDKTKQQLKDKNHVGLLKRDIASNTPASQFSYIYNYLKKLLEKEGNTLYSPYSDLKKDSSEPNPKDPRYPIWTSGQNNTLTDIVNMELKNNRAYNVEKSQVNPEGNRQYALQLNNNFTIVNKFLSDADLYPTLQDILAKEPSAFWIDPETNVNMRNSLIMHSLFYYDPIDPNYGKRRRIVGKPGSYKYSTTDGVFAKVVIVNTGGVQTRTSGEKPEGSSSTSLNDIDKLLQDINSFFVTGHNSVLRLGDKSTDLGIAMNFYVDRATDTPQIRPLSSAKEYKNIYNTEQFLSKVMDSLKDLLQMKYLANRGFLEEYQVAPKNLKEGWGYFDDILSNETKDLINSLLNDESEVNDVDIAPFLVESFENDIKNDVLNYFNKASVEFKNKFNGIRQYQSDTALIKGGEFENKVDYYLANAFLMDLEQMKVFFGDAIFFKAFHKRASKDSATGIFTLTEQSLLDNLNNTSNVNGFGHNTNLGARLLIEQLYQEKKITLDQRNQALLRQTVGTSIKSAVMQEVNFVSKQSVKIDQNIKAIAKYGHISEAMQNLYDKFISKIIKGDEKTGKKTKYAGAEADGQGRCTFDFYRTMCILTSQWGEEQEKVYEKITKYSNLQDRIENETDLDKKVELINERDALGYDPLEPVYFPPKKFQYAGPQKYTKSIEGKEFTTYVPAFDKFSLQPLIPTIIKGTPDEHLNKRMQFQGLSYIKFESASKVENPKEDLQTPYYVNYDKNNPEVRSITPFSPDNGFTSTQELFLTHLKEQVAVDAEIHDHVIFGSQIRKLVLMNLARIPGFAPLQSQYARYIDELVQLEKTKIYDDLGITREGGNLKVSNMPKLVDYFFKEIDKKNQSSSVKKALEYDEMTHQFKMPLDGAVQAQVIEGIIISAINNKVVRYNTNGSMLIQASITGSEQIKKYDKSQSQKALETFGNTELKYYDVVDDGSGVSVTKMQVKIGLTGQWLKLLTRNHPDGKAITTIERLNEALKNDAWAKAHEKELSCVSYRIPTQGRNFLDVMVVAQFLPAAFGDAIIMPTETVIKNGGDFDIDKMFMFYPNLTKDGYYQEAFYDKSELDNTKNYDRLKGAIQNRLFNVMQQIILHPANYMELVTPSDNYHILPVVDEIFKKLGLPLDKNGNRIKTDFKNTAILNREKNITKFLSLLKGKSDLGIAAKANVFNVLYQLAEAKSNPRFFITNRTTSFFNASSITKHGNDLESIDYSQTFDEDGILKSEFFSEFINAFVDTANDDYVFAMNMVTELSPVAFYMKYMGLSTSKILYFLNQPIIRDYVKSLMTLQNKFAKSSKDLQDENLRHVAKLNVLREYGWEAMINDKEKGWMDVPSGKLVGELSKHLDSLSNKESNFTSDKLLNSIRNDSDRKFKGDDKAIQLAMMLEFLNLKPQSDSITESQRYLDFDTNPYTSSFDVFARNRAYRLAVTGDTANNILSPQSLINIKEKSIISPLDVYKDLAYLLAELLPVRNSIKFNQFLLSEAMALKENFQMKAIKTADDMERLARTAKNDFINYILQNYLDQSSEGKAKFEELFETTKDFNVYLAELVQTRKLVDMFNTVRSLDSFEDLAEQYPIVRNIVLRQGENDKEMISFQIVENTENNIEKESMITQFQELVNLTSPENKIIRDFFRNLALYGMFQSGFNKSEYSFSDIAPNSIVNALYGEAVKEFSKSVKLAETKNVGLSERTIYETFFEMFKQNNPSFFDNGKLSTFTREIPKKGKWYSLSTGLKWESDYQKTKGQNLAKKEETLSASTDKTVKAIIPQNKIAGVLSFGSIVNASPEVEKVLGVAARSIDMIIAGLRTRTTRSATEMSKYNIQVGDIIKHVGVSADGTTKKVYARVTAIHQQNTPGWKGTWYKEGWAAKDVNVIDRMNPGAAAIEFELLKTDAAKVDMKVEKNNIKKVSTLDSTIQDLMDEMPWTYEMTTGDIENMYNTDKLSGETIEEFFKRMSCLGKLK